LPNREGYDAEEFFIAVDEEVFYVREGGMEPDSTRVPVPELTLSLLGLVRDPSTLLQMHTSSFL
jgi:hypothetical protein